MTKGRATRTRHIQRDPQMRKTTPREKPSLYVHKHTHILYVYEENTHRRIRCRTQDSRARGTQRECAYRGRRTNNHSSLIPVSEMCPGKNLLLMLRVRLPEMKNTISNKYTVIVQSVAKISPQFWSSINKISYMLFKIGFTG